MPIVQIKLVEGRSMEAKSKLASVITTEVVKHLKVKPEQVRIIYENISADDLFIGGTIRSEIDKK